MPNADAVAVSRITAARDHVAVAERSKRTPLTSLLDEAARTLEQAQGNENGDLSNTAAALRKVTVAQVRAAQVISAATRGEVRGS